MTDKFPDGLYYLRERPSTIPDVIAVANALEKAHNNALDEAIRACEALLTNHGQRKGGSDTADAARRGCIERIRRLKRSST